MEDEYIKTLIETEQRSKSNTKRLDEMDGQIKALNDLIVEVTKLTNEIKHTNETVGEIKESIKQVNCKVDDIKLQPASRWNKVVEQIIYLIVAAVVGYFISALTSGRI